MENSTGKVNVEREIIGYKFKDAGAYGTFFNIYYQATNKIYPYQYNLEDRINGYDIDNLDCNIYLFFCKEHEILEIIFNPIYKEEFKAGDIVVGWHNRSNELNRKPWEIRDINSQNYIFPKTENSSWCTVVGNIRRATPEEIEEFYKEEFKVGDVVVGWHTAFTDFHNNPWEIRKIDSDNFVYPKCDKSAWCTGIEDIRKATPEEIEEFNKKENEFKTEVEKAIISVDNLRKALEKLEAVT